MRQLDYCVAFKANLVQRLPDGGKVSIPFPQTLRPTAILLLIAQMQEDDLFAELANEGRRVHTRPHQPIQVWPELDVQESARVCP